MQISQSIVNHDLIVKPEAVKFLQVGKGGAVFRLSKEMLSSDYTCKYVNYDIIMTSPIPS